VLKAELMRSRAAPADSSPDGLNKARSAEKRVSKASLPQKGGVKASLYADFWEPASLCTIFLAIHYNLNS
jgi:hypothetical protein